MLFFYFLFVFFFKQKTAYEMRISDWSSDVCSSDLLDHKKQYRKIRLRGQPRKRIFIYVFLQRKDSDGQLCTTSPIEDPCTSAELQAAPGWIAGSSIVQARAFT